MAYPSDTELKALLLKQVGDDGTIGSQLDVIWRLCDPYAMYTTADGRYPLQFLKAKIEAIQILMGKYAAQFTFAKRDRKLELGKLFDNWRAMLAEAKAEFNSALVAATTVGGGVSVDQMDAQASLPYEQADGWLPDPTDTMYQGNPINMPASVQPT